MSERVNICLPEKQVEALEILVLRLRTEHRIRANKSGVMRAILAGAIEQYNQDPASCSLVRMMKGGSN